MKPIFIIALSTFALSSCNGRFSFMEEDPYNYRSELQGVISTFHAKKEESLKRIKVLKSSSENLPVYARNWVVSMACNAAFGLKKAETAFDYCEELIGKGLITEMKGKSYMVSRTNGLASLNNSIDLIEYTESAVGVFKVTLKEDCVILPCT